VASSNGRLKQQIVDSLAHGPKIVGYSVDDRRP
jgi:hypothetical protein